MGKYRKIKALFIDLDGVIIKSIQKSGLPYSVRSKKVAEVLPMVAEALKLSRKNGYLNIVITNQPDISRGKYSISDFELLKDWLLEDLELDAIYVCIHDDQDNCSCRKPKTGLIDFAVADFNIDISISFLIGDRWRDIECAQALNVNAYWLDHGYSEKKPSLPFTKVNSLFEAINRICNS